MRLVRSEIRDLGEPVRKQRDMPTEVHVYTISYGVIVIQGSRRL